LIRFLDRIVLVAFAIVVAAFAALVVGGMGLASRDFGEALATYAATLGLAGLAALMHGQPAEDIGALFEQTAVTLLAIWLCPVVLVALIGEIAGTRSWLFYATGMALAFAILPAATSLNFALLLALYRIVVGLLAMGVVAGTAYWLIAGRKAGHKAAPPGIFPPQ
jgi:hypothetical protein